MAHTDWLTSMEQAHVAATNLLGGDLRYTGAGGRSTSVSGLSLNRLGKARLRWIGPSRTIIRPGVHASGYAGG